MPSVLKFTAVDWSFPKCRKIKKFFAGKYYNSIGMLLLFISLISEDPI